MADYSSISGGLGAALGGILGAGAASGDLGQSRDAADKAYKKILDLGAPPSVAKAIVYQQFKQAGVLTPQLEQYIQSGPAQTVKEDPNLKQNQLSALNLLSQRASGGMNAEDRANLNNIRNQLAKDQESKQQQILQNYQARGIGGGGAELAAALSSSQEGANQASQEGDKMAAMAQQNALNAASQMGQLSGQMRGQDYQTNAGNANIQNEMNRFNTQNQMYQQARNVSAQNQAQQYNVSQQQQAANANTGMYNQEAYRQAMAPMQDWQNQANYAQMQSNALLGQSNDFKNRAQRTTDQNTGIGGAIGAGIGLAFGDPTTANKNDPSKARAGQQIALSHGGVVPGEAKYEGDHPANDTVDAKLSPGEIVLPRSVINSKHAPMHAANYVAWIKQIMDENNEK